MDEREILDELRLVAAMSKVGGEPAGWTEDDSGDLRLTLPLEIHEPCDSTARIAWRAVASRPDRDCSATLIVTIAGRDLRAARVDWRSEAPHINRIGPAHLRGLTMKSGFHACPDNAGLGLAAMQRNNLPICTPLAEEPHDFKAFVRVVCALLNVGITDEILEPPWSSRLL